MEAPRPVLPVTLDEQDPPVHRISRVEDRERILAEALAHAEALEEQYKVTYAEGPPKGRWKPPTAVAVMAVSAVLAVFPPALIAPRPIPEPGAGELERGLRVALFLQARQVEVFRAREGRLPTALDELPVRVDGVRFVRSNGRVYQLVADGPDGSPLIYDSARPTPGLEQVVGSWLGLER